MIATNLVGRWATGWQSYISGEVDEDSYVTGEIVVVTDECVWLLDSEDGELYARDLDTLIILERKPDEAGPYR